MSRLGGAARARRGTVIALALGAAALALAPMLLRPAVPVTRSAAPRPAPRPAPGAGAILAMLERALPANAALLVAAREADGRLVLEAATPEPDRLRAALAGSGLPRLRTTAETALPDGGFRVRLEGPREPLPPPVRVFPTVSRDPALLDEPAAAGTLALFGPEAAVRSLAGTARTWRLEALAGGVRLEAASFAAMRASPAPDRALFGGAPATPPDAPALAGVAGRLPLGAVALVRDAAGRARPVSPGEAVDGWRLLALSADAALFARGTERVRVSVPAED